MKKSTLFVAALALGMTTAFAQDLTSKKGEPILPEAGDYAIGVDATPFLSYFGNMLNGNTSNSPFGWNYTNSNMMITGKMFTSETMAYRAAIRIGFGSTSVTSPIIDDGSTSGEMTNDELKMAYNYIGLGGGLEWRRGKGRLQGYWGGMLSIGFGSEKDTYTYGNDFSTSNTNPSTTDFSSYTGYSNNVGGVRTTLMKSGSMMDIGLRGFAGAEFFVLPKVSVGGEFGWGLMFSSQGASTTDVEFWDFANNTDDSDSFEGGKESSFGIDTDNNAFGMATGAVLVHFHF